ncbi:MAG: restriction endonuclease subunit S [Candidatus Delongbacteria bacterium]|jgi:type I restriction enzyme S subunit|nr:restriction endonuclease subunit S [Candidatus Delongbacteria bacterium]
MNALYKNIPQIRFPGFSGDWVEKKLGDCINIFNGYAFSSSDSLAQGTKWVKIADVGIKNMKYDNVSYLPTDYLEKYSKFALQKGDYVVALTRPFLNHKLKIAKIDDFFHNSLLNQRVGKLESTQNKTLMYYLLQKSDLTNAMENSIAGSDPPNLSPNEIKSIKISLPALPEQEKIADFLSDVDSKIEKLSRKKDLMSEYKKGVMQKIFSQEIRFKDEDGNYYPDWVEKKLGDVCHFFSGGTPTSTNKKYYCGDIPFIKSGEINALATSQFITQEAMDSSSAKLVKKDDLLYALYGATSGTVGISKINGAINQAVLCIRTDESKLFIKEYLQLRKQDIINTFLQGGQGNLSAQIVKKLKINLPCLDEQKKIAEFLTNLDKKIENIDTELKAVKEFKKGLLQTMFV